MPPAACQDPARCFKELPRASITYISMRNPTLPTHPHSSPPTFRSAMRRRTRKKQIDAMDPAAKHRAATLYSTRLYSEGGGSGSLNTSTNASSGTIRCVRVVALLNCYHLPMLVPKHL